MPNFQQRAFQSRLSQHCLFNRGFRIAFQHHRGCAVCNMQHKRVVVGRLRTGFVALEWRENCDACLRKLKCISFAK